MKQKEIKQKIRKLKKLELMFRYGYSMEYIEEPASLASLSKLPLVWTDFFQQNAKGSTSCRYPLHTLEQMDKEELDKIFEEYWFWVYYRMYQERGLVMSEIKEPELLQYLGLPYDADSMRIKKRFHELCKLYHPDEGGDKEKFIRLMEMMERYKKQT